MHHATAESASNSDVIGWHRHNWQIHGVRWDEPHVLSYRADLPLRGEQPPWHREVEGPTLGEIFSKPATFNPHPFPLP